VRTVARQARQARQASGKEQHPARTARKRVLEAGFVQVRVTQLRVPEQAMVHCEFGEVYKFYPPPLYMYPAMILCLEGMRRVINFLVFVFYKIYGTVCEGESDYGESLWYTDDGSTDNSRRHVLAGYIFISFLAASAAFDAWEIFPYLSHSAPGESMSSWTRMVRFAVHFVNSHILRNLSFLIFIAYSHSYYRNEGSDSQEVWAIGNGLFALSGDDVVRPASESRLCAILMRATYIMALIALFMLMIVSIIFITPGTFLFVWVPVITSLLLMFFLFAYQSLAKHNPWLEWFLPPHTLQASIFWIYCVILTEVAAVFYRAGSYQDAVKDIGNCHLSFATWKEHLPRGGLLARLLF